MHSLPIVLLAMGALGAMTAALAVLYSRLFPAGSWWHSFGISAGCAAIGAATWFIIIPIAMPTAITTLFLPIGMMGAVAATLAPIALRASDPPTAVVLIFAFAWSVLVFVPVALGTLVTGVLGVMPVDHAGSLVVNVAAGAAALGILLLRRRRPEPPTFRIARPVSVAAVIVLAAGWLVWLVAAELAFDDVSVLALVTGVAGGAGGIVGWLVVQRIRHQSTTLAAVAAGLLSGLVAVSAGATLLSPVSAACTGIIAGAIAGLFTLRRITLSGRQQWFLPGSHLIAGAVGLALLGFVANDSGFLFTGQFGFMQDQLVSAIVVAAYSTFVAFLLWAVLSRVPSRRRTPQ